MPGKKVLRHRKPARAGAALTEPAPGVRHSSVGSEALQESDQRIFRLEPMILTPIGGGFGQDLFFQRRIRIDRPSLGVFIQPGRDGPHKTRTDRRR